MLFLLSGFALGKLLLVCGYSCYKLFSRLVVVDMQLVMYIRLYVYPSLLSTPQEMPGVATISIKSRHLVCHYHHLI